MKIGIISKKSHAKSHVKALRREGHKVLLLGGNPNQVPPSLDVLVCRPDSIAHSGFATAMAAKKKGMTLILANGVTEILSAIKDMQPAEEETMEVNNCANIIRVLSKLLGVYGHPLHEPKAGPVVEALASQRGADGALGLNLWKQALKACKQESVRGWARDEAAKRKGAGVIHVYSNPPRGGVRKIPMFVTDEAALGTVLSRMALARTEAGARKMKKARGAMRPKPKAEPKPKLQPQRKQESVRGWARDEVTKTVAQPQPGSPAANAARTMPPEPEPPVVAAELPWDANLRSALSLVLAEMKAAGLTAISIEEDGSVSYNRVVVTEGSMQVLPDGAE